MKNGVNPRGGRQQGLVGNRADALNHLEWAIEAFGELMKSENYGLLSIRPKSDVSPVTYRELDISSVGVSAGFHCFLVFAKEVMQSGMKFYAIN